MEYLLRREQFRKPYEHLKNGVSARQLREELFKQEADSLESQRKRKILYDRPRLIPAILNLSRTRHRQLAVKWAFGRFPLVSTTMLESKYAEVVPANIATLEDKCFRYCLSAEDLQATEASLDKLLFLTVSFFDDME